MEVNVAHLALAFGGGMGIGLFYFGGLWLTVRGIPKSRHPALLSLGSFLGRSMVAVPAFYFIMGNQWPRLPACMGGFLLMRIMLTRLARPERRMRGKDIKISASSAPPR